MKRCKRLGLEDRVQIHVLAKRGYSDAEIARDVGVHRSSIWRERIGEAVAEVEAGRLPAFSEMGIVVADAHAVYDHIFGFDKGSEAGC